MNTRSLSLVCLCAGWCRTCDGYRPVLEAVAAEHPGLALRWIDIEDEADLVGDIDVETFPTLLVAGPDGVRFFGPLTPQPETLRRVLRAALDASAALLPVPPAVQALVARLQSGKL